MGPYTRNMEQTATYWEPGVPDGFGGLDFSSITPVTINVRWQDKATLFRDTDGREVVSDAIVYCDQEIVERGWLALGDVAETGVTDPRNISGTYEIRAVQQSPSLDGVTTLYKAML